MLPNRDYKQNFIHDLMKKSFYKPDPKGLCVGITQMGVQAFFSDEIDCYNSRINDLYTLWEIIKAGEKAKVPSEEYRKYLEYLYILTTNPDYLAFFDGITIYQDPDKFPHLFDVIISQENTENISLIAASKKISEKGGLHRIKHDISLYTREELFTFFCLIQTNAGKHKFVFTLDLYTPYGHQIAVCYDGRTKEWLLVNPSRPLINEVSLFELSELVFDAHSFGKQFDMFAFSIQTFVLGHEKTSAMAIIKKLNNNFTFQSIQEITPQKALYRSKKSNLLHIAIQACHPEFVNRMANGDLININEADNFGNTALHHAVYTRNSKITLALLSKNHVVSDPQNALGQSPLYIAANYGYLSIAKIYLENGSNPYLLCKNKTNPITIAAIKGRLSTLKLFVEMGYNIFLPDGNGKTCHHYAKRYDHDEIIHFINAEQKSISDENFKTILQKNSLFSVPTKRLHEQPTTTIESHLKRVKYNS